MRERRRFSHSLSLFLLFFPQLYINVYYIYTILGTRLRKLYFFVRANVIKIAFCPGTKYSRHLRGAVVGVIILYFMLLRNKISDYIRGEDDALRIYRPGYHLIAYCYNVRRDIRSVPSE